jgi:ABC-2 type transport system permease protein
MLWYKSWLDTRWRFLIGFAVLVVMAAGILIDYNVSAQAIATAGRNPDAFTSNALLKEAIRIEQTFRGFVWYQWFRGNLLQCGTILAALLGSGSVIASPGGLYTLSLPASRKQLMVTRAATGLGELFILATVPSTMISALSPTIGQRFSVGDVTAYGLCMFVAAAVFYSLAFLLSTVFDDLWRPLLIAVGLAVVIGYVEVFFNLNGLFKTMAGRVYFETGSFPWLGLTSSAAISIVMLYGAATNIARKDF